MVKKKRQSKRVPAARRYKIEKKVREHRRKMKKEARKSGRNRLKKDPGIPNLYPFKEQMLKQLQDRKEREEEEKKRQKEARRKEQAKRRSLQGLRNDAEKRTREYEKREEVKHLMSEDSKNSHGKSDPSVKAYYKEFRRVVEASDVVLEVLDARDPMGSRCFEMEQTVLASGSNKKLILVLNKIDLVPRNNVEQWLKYLRNEFPTVTFKASTQTQRHNLSRKKFPLGSGPVTMEKSSVCLGAEVLMKLLGNYCRNLDIKTSITVGIVGLPNVGKSSIINSLKRNRVCNVGATPGVTRSMQEIQLDSHIKLLDSPGLVLMSGASDDPVVALRNCVKVESLSDVVAPVDAILRRCNKMEVMKHYCIADYQDTMEFLSLLAKRTGKLRKGGIADSEAAARSVLHDWNSGRINFYTHPPEQQTLPAHISAEIVKEWGRELDLTGLQKEEDKILEGLIDKWENALVMECSEPVQEMAVVTGSDEEDNEEEDPFEEDMFSEEDSSVDEIMEEQEQEEEGNRLVVIMKPSGRKDGGVPRDHNDQYDFNKYF